MALNANYMIAPSLQEYFVDKNTGLPLVGGQVYFYSDVNRTSLKDIYQLSGSPPNYGYTLLPNPITLTGVGTFSDGQNNDVIPYYYPYNSAGNVELYYIRVFDQNGQEQFTREGWPNFVTNSGGTTEADFTNYVPNGQFLLHNANQPLSTTEFDSTGIDYTPVAQGGWYFARSHGSTATDTISFPVYQNYTSDPAQSPRFSIKAVRTVTSSDIYCDIRLRFDDVNKFGDPNQLYLLQFSAQSNSGSPLSNVVIGTYKYFGTGTNNSPSPPLPTPVKTVSIPVGLTTIPVLINFDTNDRKTIGDNNDDFIEIYINLNGSGLNATFDVQLTDVVLTPYSNQTEVVFPVTPDSEFVYQSMGGYLPVPNPDGSDLFLPIKSSPTGFVYDRSEIGKVQYTLRQTADATTNELLCDGSQYKTTDYSSLGVPYSRLQAHLVSISPFSANNLPLFGTGANYLTTYISTGATTGNVLRICTNKGLSQTAASDGTPATGLGISVGTPGNNSLGYIANAVSSSEIECRATFLTSSFVTPVDHTSGALILNVNNNQGNINYCRFTISASSRPAAGTYFTFSNATTNFYMWFKIDGAGTDPAVGGTTGIAVNLSSAFDTNDTINAIREAISGFSQTIIACNAGSTIAAGSYLKIYANDQLYVVWYKVNNVGIKPSVDNAEYIEVDILNSDTNAQVAQKTQIAMNQLYFAVPDFRGMFFRNYDGGIGIDYDRDHRAGAALSYLFGDSMGTFEYNEIQSHTHSIVAGFTLDTGPVVAVGSGSLATLTPINATGGTETRPINAYINTVIKY